MDVLWEDWCIALVSKFLSFETIGRWDEAMCSSSPHREKWLVSLGKMEITAIDEYHHHYNESIRWLISRRIKYVTKISICLRQEYYDERTRSISKCNLTCHCPEATNDCIPEVVKSSLVCGKTFCGAHLLEDLKSIVLHENKRKWYIERSETTDSYISGILESLAVNCKSLENFEFMGQSAYEKCINAAAHMAQKLSRLRCFTYAHFPRGNNDEKLQELSTTTLVQALAEHCPLLESLHLNKYGDGVAQLVAGCPRLHTITIDSYHVTIDGCRAFGRSRSITTLHLNAWCSEDTTQILNVMADKGMPLRTIDLYSDLSVDVNDWTGETFGDIAISIVARFAPTLEKLTIKDLYMSPMRDEGLEVLQQCHQLRFILVQNLKMVSGSFFLSVSEGCPLLESVRVEQFSYDYMSDRYGTLPLERSAYTNIDFRPCFERCPKLKHIVLTLCSDEQIKAMVHHCPLVEEAFLGCCNLQQELSSIIDEALITVAQGLPLLSKLTLTNTQCTDAGLKALSVGMCRHTLTSLSINDGSWEQGYPTLLTQKGIQAVIVGCPNLTEIHCDEMKMKKEEVRCAFLSRK